MLYFLQIIIYLKFTCYTFGPFETFITGCYGLNVYEPPQNTYAES